MSNRLFQGLVHQMRDTIDATVGVVDDSATIIACSDLTKVGTTNEFVSLDLSDVHDIFIRDGYTYKPFGSPNKPEYAVFVEGVDDAAAKYANILAIALFNVKQYYDEKICSRNNYEYDRFRQQRHCQAIILSSRQENCILMRKSAGLSC